MADTFYQGFACQNSTELSTVSNGRQQYTMDFLSTIPGYVTLKHARRSVLDILQVFYPVYLSDLSAQLLQNPTGSSFRPSALL